MRLTDFWTRLEAQLGRSYARSWARDFVLSDLGGRSAQQALDAGVETRVVWEAVAEALELPRSAR
jgi:hypothetical protein